MRVMRPTQDAALALRKACHDAAIALQELREAWWHGATDSQYAAHDPVFYLAIKRAEQRQRRGAVPVTGDREDAIKARHQRGNHSLCDYATCYEARQLRHYGERS
jgi:hypothetical protein